MPKPRPPHLHRQVNRHGKTRWYVRVRKGKRIRIDGDYGSAAFLRAYDDAIRGIAKEPHPVRASRGTFRWLVDNWRRSSDWAAMAQATRNQRDNILADILKRSGDREMEAITTDAIRAGREKRHETPAAANNFLKTMRALFRWAKDAGFVDQDPARDVKFLKVKTKGFTPWVLDDVRAYRARWPLGTRQRLALEILINTGLRRGDVVRVGRQHVRDQIIHIRAGKNGVELYIPMLPCLADAIAAGPVGEMSFLSSRFDRPMTKESFGNMFREWCDAAGVRGKSAHGIRKLAASTLAEGGGSENELQALFGWTTNTMSQVYTREASRKHMALQAAFKLLTEMERNEAEKPLSLPSPKTQTPSP